MGNVHRVIWIVVTLIVLAIGLTQNSAFAVSTYHNSTGTSCTGGDDFSCPLDLSQQTAVGNSVPNKIAGVGTSNGYFSIWEQNVTSTDFRLFFASTTDGVTATTPIDISGTTTTSGIDQDQMFIFEDDGKVDIFWKEIDTGIELDSIIYHARSTNGGTSFGAKTQIQDLVDIFFPAVDGDNIFVAYEKTDSAAMKFKKSTNGGTSFTSEVLMDGGSDECNAPEHPIKMVQDSITLHVAWYGTFAGNATQAICYNQSTDSGDTWGSTVQILSNTVVDQGVSNDPSRDLGRELEIYISGTKVAVIYENLLDDLFMQARSTNSGVSFGSPTIVLDTVDLTKDDGCTDPSPLAKSWGDDDNIYISCTGNAGWGIKNSTDFGLTYNLIVDSSDDASGGRFSFADEPLGFATGSRVFAVSVDNDPTPDQMQFLFSSDGGITYDNSITMFMTADIPYAITGNSTHVWIGFAHSQGGVTNAWVSLAIFPPVTPSDSDGDGIADTIDLSPFFSNDFTDGTTFGTITSGNANLSITDDPVNGVNIAASGPATVSTCGTSTLTFTVPTQVTVTCGSVSIVVIDGSVDVEFTDGDSTATITLESRDTITFEDETFTITNNGDEPVTVVVDGEEIILSEGETISFKPAGMDNLFTNNLCEPLAGTILQVLSCIDNLIADLDAANARIAELVEALLGPGNNEYSPEQCAKFQEIADAQAAKGKEMSPSLRSQLVACGLL